MNRKIAAGFTLAGLMMGAGSPMLVLAENGTVTSTSTAITTTKFDPQCIITAVDTRDTALMGAVDARDTALKSALSARKDALKAAWLLTGKDRTKALRDAWKAYRTAVQGARNDFRKAYLAAWKQFNVSKKACGKTANTDTTSSGVDISL